MKARLVKKLEKQQAVELILSAHRERQITNIEAKEALKEKSSGFLNDILVKESRLIDKILEQNKMNNNRHLKRSRLFSAESLAIKLFSGAEALAK